MVEKLRQNANTVALIGLSLTAFINISVVIWGAAKIDSRVYALECWMQKSEARVASIDVIRTNMENQTAMLREIKERLNEHAKREWETKK